MFLCERTDVKYDLNRVLTEWENVQNSVKWYRDTQTALQYAEGNECQYTDPCGSFTNRVSENVNREQDIDQIVPDYKGTIFENIMNEWGAYRTRVLCRKKQTTYSLHTDVNSVRFHLALVTNDTCYVVYPQKEKLFHIPADGYVYRMNTHEPHTVMNCGEDRYHLVWGSREVEEMGLRYAGY